ncbi:MAG: hypothetical protein ACTSPI_17365 [Candidatus Heimdallarchaeaceae archaeon]
MNYEKKIILTTTELREIVMSAWVDGWYSESKTDSEKILYTANLIQDLTNEM